jgi:type VI secretion system protein ImpF
MAELTPTERLQPCLLDRLTDDEPQTQRESRDRRVVSLRRYRAGVLRDLAWLLNCSTRLTPDEVAEFPEVQRSVLNFGTRDLCGVTISGFDPIEVERELLRAVQCFEPRILPGSLSIKLASGSAGEHNAVAFTVTGHLWAQPMPEELYIKTEFDLETGQCELEGSSGG